MYNQNQDVLSNGPNNVDIDCRVLQIRPQHHRSDVSSVAAMVTDKWRSIVKAHSCKWWIKNDGRVVDRSKKWSQVLR